MKVASFSWATVSWPLLDPFMYIVNYVIHQLAFSRRYNYLHFSAGGN